MRLKSHNELMPSYPKMIMGAVLTLGLAFSMVVDNNYKNKTKEIAPDIFSKATDKDITLTIKNQSSEQLWIVQNDGKESPAGAKPVFNESEDVKVNNKFEHTFNIKKEKLKYGDSIFSISPLATLTQPRPHFDYVEITREKNEITAKSLTEKEYNMKAEKVKNSEILKEVLYPIKYNIYYYSERFSSNDIQTVYYDNSRQELD